MLTYGFDANAEDNGIPALLRRMSELGTWQARSAGNGTSPARRSG